ncbi:response regulator [Halonotius terrestris]|uniref:histidine kinase n=1 Tax=Halonotius terrestris TaxID=2487750 RepID=A0A8J8PB68_9EURY|nr:ATP-binding protein [Halonotius terrestris]TQQ80020.1 response regulator [Halonotius terrestris]
MRTESLSILVVDDSEFFGNLVADTLESDHDMVTTAITDARAALSDVEFETVDCIVSDYQMPDLDGLEFYQAIADETDLPFILVTSEGDEEVASRAIRMGVDEYILKQDIFEEESLGLLANRIDNIVDRRRTQRKYEQLVDNSPDEISQVRLDGTILAANDKMAKAFNTSESKMVGSQLSAFLPEDVAANRLKQGQRATTAGSVVTFQDSIGLRHFHNIVVPLATGGEESSVQIVTREITLQKHNEEELKRKKEELAIINRIVSHDIKNDVNILSGWAEVLKDRVDDEYLDMLSHIEETSTHIAELTEITKDFVESLEGDADVELDAVDLATIIDTEVEKLRSDHDAVSVTVDREDDIEVRANELLASVVGNLLSNAVRHNDSDTPAIEITTERSETTLTLRIADNGPGVPDGQKEEIFGKGSKGPESPGTGIGLYLAHKLVDQYHGEIWIEDNEPTGAVFVVELPLSDPDV